jgi:hypothetical protein
VQASFSSRAVEKLCFEENQKYGHLKSADEIILSKNKREAKNNSVYLTLDFKKLRFEVENVD